MRTRSRFLLPVLLVLSGLPPVHGEGLRSRTFLAESREGFDHLYNLEHRQARLAFDNLRRSFPQHPGPPLYLASTVWLEELFNRQDLDLDKFTAPGHFAEETDRKMPEEDVALFHELLAESEAFCRQILETQPDDVEARYFLGAVRGVQAAYSMTIDRSMKKAFGLGKEAYRLHLEILEEQPSFHDAYMTTGMYEYIVGSLPWYIKWLAKIIGYRGTKERGFEYLSLAAENGTFVADDSRVLQMVLLVREKMYDRALNNARVLCRKYPRNYLLLLNQAQILEKSGRMPEAFATYFRIEELAARSEPNFQKLELQGYRRQLGARLREHGRLRESDAVLSRALDGDPSAETYLERGKTRDLLELRDLAVEDYASAARLAESAALRVQAQKRLEKPYTQ